jgi:hypothetical protein
MEYPVVDLSTPVIMPNAMVAFKGNTETVIVDVTHLVNLWRRIDRAPDGGSNQIFMIKTLRMMRSADGTSQISLRLAKDITEWIKKRYL